jgi:hypothetical protein
MRPAGWLMASVGLSMAVTTFIAMLRGRTMHAYSSSVASFEIDPTAKDPVHAQ